MVLGIAVAALSITRQGGVFCDIIVLTSLVGAAAIVTSLAMGPTLRVILFVILAGIGIAIQSRALDRANQPRVVQAGSSAPGEGQP